MKREMHGETPQILLENRDELAFARHVFCNDDEFGPDKGVAIDLCNTLMRVDDGEKLFPVVLVGEEARVAEYGMTILYLYDDLWGELAEEITTGTTDFLHSHAAA